MRAHVRLVVTYGLFAAFSTLVNLLVQYVSFDAYKGPFSLYVGMAFGTLAGLVVKYVLDKKYIFFHVPKSRVDDGRKFVLYSAMGVVTTAIFWGFEIAFAHLWAAAASRYVGAVLGLAVGYVTKYFLDKRFVFVERG